MIGELRNKNQDNRQERLNKFEPFLFFCINKTPDKPVHRL